MSDIFISHAVADQKLAKLLVEFLKEGIGVPAKAIFCSSVKGHDIPLGDDFNDYIRDKIQKPKLVILLMTPAYIESAFCLMELGAAWTRALRTLPIVVPPIEFQVVTKTLGLKQAWKITNDAGLIDLRDLVRETIPSLETRTEHTWDDKRKQWAAQIKKILPKIQPATKVDADRYEKLLDKSKQKSADIARLEAVLEKAKQQIAELEMLKDKEEVKAVKRKADSSEVLQKEFDDLIEAVDDAKPEVSKVVLRHIISDHFDRAGTIDWASDRAEFEEAVQYGLISPEDSSVEWKRPKLAPLRKALESVEMFMQSADGAKLRKLQNSDVPMDPDDLEFWKHHLSI